MVVRQKLFDNILTSGMTGLELGEEYRLKILNTFLLVSTIVMFIIFLYRLIHGSETGFLLVDAGVCLFFFGCFISLRMTQNIERVVGFLTFSLVLFTDIFVAINRNDQFALVWSYMIPPFIILLNSGKKWMLYILFYYGAIFFSMFSMHAVWVKEGWTDISTVRYVTTSAGLTFITAITKYLFTMLYDKLQTLSTKDELTGLDNRRSISEIIDSSIERLKRYGKDGCADEHLALVLFDIDNFKKVNDSRGHLFGDEVLRELGKILQREIRTTDSIGRWGGEEFCIVMPRTGITAAKEALMRLQKKIREHNFGFEKPITCSFGLHGMTAGKEVDKEKLIAGADAALYQAKTNGKDRICIGDCIGDNVGESR